MDADGLGGEFRALRVAAGRTVASVAVDAGLSVPYIANLENGRGNPTIGALGRLAAALGRRLVVGLAADEAGRGSGSDNSKKQAAAMPPSLIRFARTQRFRGAAAAMAAADRRNGTVARQDDAASDQDVTAGLLSGLAGLANAIGAELSDGDWARLVDALVLVTAHPCGE